MRFVPFNCIREGMTLGQTLFGPGGEVLLRDGTEFKDNYIDKLKGLGFNGVYIIDDLSKDIEVHEMVSMELKNKTTQAIKNMFIHVERSPNGAKIRPEDMDAVKDLLEMIFNELYSNRKHMVNMLDIKIFDDYTYHHSTNVAVLSLILGIAMGIPKNRMVELGMAAIFHDIGKVFVPKEILNKEGEFTEEEFEIMKEHSRKGYEYLKDFVKLPPRAYVGVLQHHERFNGEGYPQGLSGKDISLFARIITITDVFDALTSDRTYRKGLLPSEAMEYIMGNGGMLFDHEIVKIFAKKVAPYPIGTYVHLSDGREGLVVENYEECCLRPKVKVIQHEGVMLETFYYLDLKEDSATFSVTIKGVGELAPLASYKHD